MNIENRIAEIKKSKAEFLEMTAHWDSKKLQFSPEEKSWNAIKIIEHVMTSEFGTLAYLKKKTQAPASEIPIATEENKFNSSELNKALVSDKKWQAPAVMPVPQGSKSRDQLIEFWDGTTDRLERFALGLDPEYHDRQVFKHPIAGRLNLDQTLEFLSKHIEHHKKQIIRLEI